LKKKREEEQRKAEEERKRTEEMKKAEEEKKRKAEIEKKASNEEMTKANLEALKKKREEDKLRLAAKEAANLQKLLDNNVSTEKEQKSNINSEPQQKQEKENEKKPEQDHEIKFVAKNGTVFCAKCQKPILNKFLKIGEEVYHPDCLTCFNCGCPIIDFFRVDGHLYCVKCGTDTLPKCHKCGKPIEGQFLNALDNKWHPECFVCAGCEKKIDSQFFNFEGMPYCSSECLAKKQGKYCTFCHKIITGKMLMIEDKPYHNSQECFHCTLCNAGFPDLKYYVVNDNFYCANCASKAHQ